MLTDCSLHMVWLRDLINSMTSTSREPCGCCMKTMRSLQNCENLWDRKMKIISQEKKNKKKNEEKKPSKMRSGKGKAA